MEQSLFSGDRPSLLSRLIGVFLRPRSTFEALRQQHGPADWLVPIAIVSCVSLAGLRLTYPTLMAEQKAAIENGDGMSAQEREKALTRQEQLGQQGLAALYVLTPVNLLLVAAVQAGASFAAASFGLGKRARYAEVLVVTCTSALVGVPATGVRVVLMLLQGTSRVYTGLGALAPRNMEGTLLHNLLAQVDGFVLWQLGLVAVGISVLYEAPFRKAATVVFAVWGFWVLAWTASSRLLGG